MSRRGDKPDQRRVQEDAPPLIYSTTLGRLKFPDFMQMAAQEKEMFAFDRHGRILGAIVPLEAIKILAGRGDELSPIARAHIKDKAEQLLQQAPAESGVSAFARGDRAKAPRALVELEEIEARRARRVAKVVKKRRRV